MGVNDANMDLFSCNSTTVAWKLETAFISLAFSLIFLVGTVGNCLVLAVLFRTGKMNTKTTSLFIFNLGIADLSFIVFCVPFQATIYTMDEWVFGPVFCKVVHFLIFLTMHASIFTLAAVSLDRYQAICYPLHSRQMRTPRNALASISLVWLLALLFSGPYLSYYRQVELGGGRACLPVWEPAPRLAMDMCTLVFGYLLPFAVLGVTYARTVRHLWTSADPPRTPDVSESRRAKRRVTKMLVAVAALFGLCWLPHHLLVLCMWFGPFPLNHTTYALRILSHLLAYVNSCLNPVVYALVSRHFRKGFGKLFCCALKKGAGNRPHAASRKAVHTASSAETSN
ncbi:galanin receptor 2a [Gadus chalcogrammus]|uniref:galanin receptor 2a n=1 Tax=Gadus chalcogrammus TaxID=1042646 RepID=UPI0024C483A9|nr:galanin receptor 2a [Gadus chalcogrammus]